ncbi:MAG: hypothetical protein ABR570_05525 [Burkholderiales bacterium]
MRRDELHLVRDVLDTQVRDREERAMGKVDGIGLELREGAPPRVAYFEIDGVTAWSRIGPRFARWAGRIAALWERAGHPYRFTWSQVRELDIDLELDVDAERTAAFDLERWLRDKFVSRLPGGR